MDEQYGQLIEPAPVRFSFGAPGWYVLWAIMLLLLVGIAWLVWRYYERNRYRREALRQITGYQKQHHTAAMNGSLLYETNMLLKRIAMAKYGRPDTAHLAGDAWIDFLNRTARRHLFGETDRALLQDIYKVYATEDNPASGFLARAATWIREHKRLKS